MKARVSDKEMVTRIWLRFLIEISQYTGKLRIADTHFIDFKANCHVFGLLDLSPTRRSGDQDVLKDGLDA